MGDLLGKLTARGRLNAQEVRQVLRQLGYRLARRRGSHEQWVKSGRTFTVACHGKDVPWYLLDALRNIAGENHEKEGAVETRESHGDKKET